MAKDLSGKSSLYSLSEFRGLRFDANYEQKYLTGQLGAIHTITTNDINLNY